MNEDKASRYHRSKRRAALVTIGLDGVLLALLLASGGSAGLRDVAVGSTGAGADAWPTVAIYVCVLAGAHALIMLPLTFYDGFVLEQRYGLSSESPGDFVRDRLKAALLNAGLALAGAEIVYAAMRTWPHAWWLASSSALAGGIALLAWLAPVLLLPLFYRFRPLARQELRDRLTALSRRAGVRLLGVYEWGLGAKSRRANAALVGSGVTRRVLLSDTLLAEYSDDEIEVILAHELGHHTHGDVSQTLLLEAAFLALSMGASALALRALWRPLQLAGPSDVAGLPLLVLAGGALMLCTNPVRNLVSRHHERRADRFALALTARPDAFVSAMRRLGAQNLAESNPSRLAVWLFHSHPPVGERIAVAQQRFPSPAASFLQSARADGLQAPGFGLPPDPAKASSQRIVLESGKR